MPNTTFFPRFILPTLEAAMSDTPVIIIHGPRQCGKSTLAQLVGAKHGHTYLSFDDDNLLQAAREDPIGFCADLPELVILDEIQRVPELFTTIKAIVDKNRIPGRFILTGSANILLIPKLADSLAGRMEVIQLSPLSQQEISKSSGQKSFLDHLFSGIFPSHASQRLGDELLFQVLSGGYPPVHARSSFKRRRMWQKQYIDALTLRDIKGLSNIHSLNSIPKLLEAAASQTAHLLNISKLASFFELSRPTVQSYLTLLEHIFLIERLPAYHNNRLKRLVKTPKIHMLDTGLAGALLGLTPNTLKNDRSLYGQLLETYIYQQLRQQSTWSGTDYKFYHYRDKDQVEVDIVIESPNVGTCGVEIKASSSVTISDFKGLKRFRDIQENFVCGVVVYDGDKTLRFGDQLYAIPFSRI